jgi:CRP/FNR family transcriptional regulator, cyclic AMP receptor protein
VVAANALAPWVVPAVLSVILIVAAWFGLRWVRSEHMDTLRSVPLFRALSDSQLGSVLRSAHGADFGPGATIVRQGEPGRGMFVLAEGRAKVVVDRAEVATLGPGSYFGEMAVIDGGPRTATIVAETEVATLEITPQAFLRLLEREPTISAAIGRELRDRLITSGKPVEDSDAPVDLARLVELSRALRLSHVADWAAAATRAGRRLRFSSLVARGS